MLLSFIMYKQEDAIYIKEIWWPLLVMWYYSWERRVTQFLSSIGTSNSKHLNMKMLYMIVSVKWPGWYAYMAGDAIGNLRGWKGHPGDQGIFKIEPHHGGTFKITSIKMLEQPLCLHGQHCL